MLFFSFSCYFGKMSDVRLKRAQENGQCQNANQNLHIKKKILVTRICAIVVIALCHLLENRLSHSIHQAPWKHRQKKNAIVAMFCHRYSQWPLWLWPIHPQSDCKTVAAVGAAAPNTYPKIRFLPTRGGVVCPVGEQVPISPEEPWGGRVHLLIRDVIVT